MNVAFTTNTFSTAAAMQQQQRCDDDRCWPNDANDKGKITTPPTTIQSPRRPLRVTKITTTPTASSSTPLQRRAARQRVLKEWITPEMIQKAFVVMVPPSSSSPVQQKKKQQQQPPPPTPKQPSTPKQQSTPVVDLLARGDTVADTANRRSMEPISCVTPSASDAATKHSFSTTTTTSSSSNSNGSTTSTVVVRTPGPAVSTPHPRIVRRHRRRQQQKQSKCTTPMFHRKKRLPLSAKARRLRHEMILTGEMPIQVLQQRQQQQHLPWLPVLSPGGLYSANTSIIVKPEKQQQQRSKLRPRKQQHKQRVPPPRTNNNSSSRLHKDQKSRETMAEIEQHRRYFRTLRPQRRRIQFVGDSIRNSSSSILADPICHYDGSPVTTLLASCHVSSLSMQDLNMSPISPRRRPFIRDESSCWSAALDPSMASSHTHATTDTTAAQQGGGDNNNSHGCGGGGGASTTSVRSLDGSHQSGCCKIRSAYEEKRLRAHEHRKRQQRIHKLEKELDSTLAKADYVEELMREQDRPRYRAMTTENQQLRRQLLVAARAAQRRNGGWSGWSHPQMMAQEDSLQKKLQQLNQEIALLEEQQQQQVGMATTMQLSLDPIETSDHPAVAAVVASASSSPSGSTGVVPQSNMPRTPQKPPPTPTKGNGSTTPTTTARKESPQLPPSMATPLPNNDNKSNNHDSTIATPAPMVGANNSRSSTAESITGPGRSENKMVRSERPKKTKPSPSGRRKRNAGSSPRPSGGCGLDRTVHPNTTSARR